MAPIIETSHVGKRYRLHEFQTVYRTPAFWPRLAKEILWPSSQRNSNDDFWALRNVSFEMEEGEILGVIGPNGAGKTTLLRLLCGISRPTHGDIKVKGRIGALIAIGAGFHGELTGLENIYLNGAIMGMSKREIDQKFDDIVDFAEIREFLNTPLKRYSSGMAVRLGFSVASHLDPDVLLVDEVLSVGDVAFRQKSLARMREMFNSGVTIVFVSHNLSMVESLCERAILLVEGKVELSSDPSSVVAQYLNKTMIDLASHNFEEDYEKATVASKVLVQGVEFYSKDGVRIDTCQPGEDINLIVKLKVLRPVKEFECRISFWAPSPMKLASIILEKSIPLSQGWVSLKWKIHQIPFSVGAYELVMKLKADGTIYSRPIGKLIVNVDDKFVKRHVRKIGSGLTEGSVYLNSEFVSAYNEVEGK